ncbi:MAG TPA: FAD-dependent oxidoreductase [Candidatus Blautia stercoripullorum]|uniref:FAD-dependent oxidoreductase n=1 Tax=Candidatus Blautia stercoripullorum TaxID=2838502 RepID=A0A9D2R503_9FIRM|nr:FAD-dependent oxidoreductase [Candidatus Blautia stercoripullorum]
MADKFYDGVIIGGGPAGLAAAIYLARARYRVLVVEKETMGGQIIITSEVVNYPGVLHTDGKKLTEEMRKQAQNFGAEFLKAQVTGLVLEGDKKKILTDKGEIQALGVVLATGASPRQAGFTGEEEFRARGVAYCATCDGEFFTGKDLFVVGGGFAAVEEALFLTRYARKIRVVVRGKQFSCAGSAVEELLAHPDISVSFETEITEAGGRDMLEYVVLRKKDTGDTFTVQAEEGENLGIFVFAGYVPATELFRDQVKVSDKGYLLVNRKQETNVPGVYGAGDVCEKELRQVVTAVSDGAVAATSMEKYLFSMYQKLGIKRERRSTKKVKKPVQAEEKKKTSAGEEGFLTGEMKESLAPVFARFEKEILVKVYLDDSYLSREVEGFVREMEPLSEKVRYEIQGAGAEGVTCPSLRICDSQGNYLGAEFHGVPGGHEFNSFIIALYNGAGPGQSMGEDIRQRIQKITGKTNLKIAVSLSCTMCPDVVMEAQKIALENPLVTAEMFDLVHYPDLKEKYQIMSVPCLIINDSRISFGKKGIGQILDLLEEI